MQTESASLKLLLNGDGFGPQFIPLTPEQEHSFALALGWAGPATPQVHHILARKEDRGLFNGPSRGLCGSQKGPD